VPVVLATVTSRSVLAQGPDDASVSGCASISPSGWLHRGNAELRQTNCGSLDQSGLDPATATQDPLTTQDPLIQQDPLVTQDPLLTQDPLATTPPPPPPPVTDPGTTQHGNGNGNGNGNGKGKGTGKTK
jgi:hypothetical protein